MRWLLVSALAMPEDEAVVHDFCIELHQARQVSDATPGKGPAVVGDKGRDGLDRHQWLLQPAVHGDECRAHHGARILVRAVAYHGIYAGMLLLNNP